MTSPAGSNLKQRNADGVETKHICFQSTTTTPPPPLLLLLFLLPTFVTKTAAGHKMIHHLNAVTKKNFISAAGRPAQRPVEQH